MTRHLAANDSAETTGRRNPSLLLLLAAFAFIYLGWSWTDQLVGLGGDNAFYMLMAQHYSPYSDRSSNIAEYFTSHSQFPPLYPMALALLGGANNFLVAHQITTGLLVLSFAVLPMWAIGVGLPTSVCAVLVAAFAMLPGTYTQTLYLHSENLYLLLTLVCFTIAAKPQHFRTQHLALALLAAAAALTRTAGIALVGAVAIHLMIRRPAGWLGYLVVAIMPVALWNVHAYSLGVHYVASVAPAPGSNFVEQIIARLTTQLQALQYGWVQNFTSLPSLWAHCLILGLLCIVASVARLIRLELDGIYVFLYLMMMLLWPFPAEAIRFMFVIVPVLLVQGAWLIAQLLTFTASDHRFRQAAGVVPAAALVLAFPSVLLALHRLQISLPDDLAVFKRDPAFLAGTADDALLTAYSNNSVAHAMDTIAAMVSPNDCVLAIKPSVVSLLSDRLAKAPPRSSASATEFDDAVLESGCNHVLMLNMVSPSYDTPMYPWSRMSNRVEILQVHDFPGKGARMTVAVLGVLRTHQGKAHADGR